MRQERRIVARASAWLAAIVLLAAAPFANANEALLAAATRGDVAEVRAFAESGVNLNYKRTRVDKPPCWRRRRTDTSLSFKSCWRAA